VGARTIGRSPPHLHYLFYGNATSTGIPNQCCVNNLGGFEVPDGRRRDCNTPTKIAPLFALRRTNRFGYKGTSCFVGLQKYSYTKQPHFLLLLTVVANQRTPNFSTKPTFLSAQSYLQDTSRAPRSLTHPQSNTKRLKQFSVSHLSPLY
jgi:hypothetical protein